MANLFEQTPHMEQLKADSAGGRLLDHTKYTFWYGPCIVKRPVKVMGHRIQTSQIREDDPSLEVVFTVLDKRNKVCWKSEPMNSREDMKKQFDSMRRSKYGWRTVKDKKISDEQYPLDHPLFGRARPYKPVRLGTLRRTVGAATKYLSGC